MTFGSNLGLQQTSHTRPSEEAPRPCPASPPAKKAERMKGGPLPCCSQGWQHPKAPPPEGQGPSHALCSLLVKEKGSRDAAEPRCALPGKQRLMGHKEGASFAPPHIWGPPIQSMWGPVPQEPPRSTINQVGGRPDEMSSDDRKKQICGDTGNEYLAYSSTRQAPSVAPESAGPLSWPVGPRSLI